MSPNIEGNLDLFGHQASTQRSALDLDRGSTVVSLFEAQVGRTPSSCALKFEADRVTYDELNRKVNQLAYYLRSKGVGTESRVAVLLERSISAVVAILGILKAGGAYVPVDPAYPQDRIATILRQARPVLILSSNKLAGSIPSTDSHVVSLDSIQPDSAATSNPDPTIDGRNLAYVIYTSGSTGEPKGIAGTHASIINGLARPPRDATGENEVWCLNLSLSFGASISRLFLALFCGIPLVIISEAAAKDLDKLSEVLEGEAITNVMLVTPLFYEILRGTEAVRSRLAHIRTFLIGGASTPPDLLPRARAAFPDAQIINGYAASEVGGPVFVWTLQARSGVATGQLFPNLTLHILNEDSMPLRDGQIGEIYVGAPHLTRGYWHDPKLTAERFVPDPFSQVPGNRLLRTGDIGCRLEDGAIELHGRVDDQLKIRGFRVELAEIEAALSLHPDIREAAVSFDAAESRLSAFLVTAVRSMTVTELRHHLSLHLPEYMFPATFAFVEGIPRTLTGKIDRLALLNLRKTELSASDSHSGPQTFVETSLIEIWRDVLGIENIGINDDFFELGGHSLIAIQLLNRILSELSIELTLSQLLEHTTIARLAAYLSLMSAEASKMTLEPVRVLGAQTEAPVTAQQEVCLAKEATTGIDQSLVRFGLSIESPVDEGILEESINRIIERHDVLRTSYTPVATKGPVRSHGWSAVQNLSRTSDGGYGKLSFTQTVQPNLRIRLEVLDYTTSAGMDPGQVAAMSDFLNHPFDYSRPPHVRVLLQRLSPTTSSLYVVMPHLVSDAWSTRIFARELSVFYSALLEGKPPKLRPLTAQYADFAAWQARKVAEQPQGPQFDNIDRSSLPFLKSPKQTFGLAHREAQRRTILLGTERTGQLRLTAQRYGVTSSMVVFSAYSLLLNLLSQKERFGISILQANRIHPHLEDLIGFIASNNRVCMDFAGDPSLETLLKQARQQFSEATLRLFLTPSTAGRPSTDIHGFSFERTGGVEFASTSNLNLRPFRVLAPERALASLALVVDEDRHDMSVSCKYCSDCYSESVMQGVLQSLETLIETTITNPETLASQTANSIALSLRKLRANVIGS